MTRRCARRIAGPGGRTRPDAQRVEERSERSGPLELVARGPERREPRGGAALDEPFEHRGLADARFALHSHERRDTTGRPLQRLGQPIQFVVATYEHLRTLTRAPCAPVARVLWRA